MWKTKNVYLNLDSCAICPWLCIAEMSHVSMHQCVLIAWPRPLSFWNTLSATTDSSCTGACVAVDLANIVGASVILYSFHVDIIFAVAVCLKQVIHFDDGSALRTLSLTVWRKHLREHPKGSWTTEYTYKANNIFHLDMCWTPRRLNELMRQCLSSAKPGLHCLILSWLSE